MIRKCHPCQQLQLTNQCPLCNKPTEVINSFESVIIHHLITILDKLDITYFIQKTVLYSKVPVDLIEIQIENRVGNYVARLYVHEDMIAIVITTVTTFTIVNNVKIKLHRQDTIRIPLADPNCFQQFHTAILQFI